MAVREMSVKPNVKINVSQAFASMALERLRGGREKEWTLLSAPMAASAWVVLYCLMQPHSL